MWQVLIAIGILVGVSIFLFGIFFIYKQVQFVIMSVNLYKKMVNRQDAMVRLLLDIRDNTKRYSENMLPEEIECPHCGHSLELEDSERQARRFSCPDCGKEIDLSQGQHIS